MLFFKFLKSTTFFIQLIIAINIVILITVSCFYFLRYYTHYGEETYPPNLVGLDLEEATHLMDKEGLAYQIDTVFNSDKKPNTILKQYPDYKSKVKKGRILYIEVNTEEVPEIKFPNIIHTPFLDASSILLNRGLKIRDTLYINDISEDNVLLVKTVKGRYLYEGDIIKKGSEIVIYVGDGQRRTADVPDILVPMLIGKKLKEAKKIAEAYFLTLGKIDAETSITDSLNAIVIKQFPEHAIIDSNVVRLPLGAKIDISIRN